jgi:hypothetical protein
MNEYDPHEYDPHEGFGVVSWIFLSAVCVIIVMSVFFKMNQTHKKEIKMEQIDGEDRKRD